MPAQVVRLTDADTGATADVLVSLGFNCFSWRSTFTGDADTEPRELLWAELGFEAGDKRPSRSGTPLLAPFPGRIAGGEFEWQGERYNVSSDDGLGNAIHGFAHTAAWRVTDEGPDRVTAEFQLSLDAPDALPQWPGDYRLTATYRIGAGRLDFGLKAENLAEGPLPFGFGTHAYFRLPLSDGADPEATVVTAPVDAEWATEGLIPTGATMPIGSDDALPAGAPLAERTFDTPFRFVSGAGVTDLVDPSSERRVRQTYDASMRCCVIYTPDHREAICLEPYTCVPDPFALEAAGVETGLITLPPGGEYATTITLEASVVA